MLIMDYIYKILPVFFLCLATQAAQAETFKVNQTKNDPNIKLGFEQRDIAYSKAFADKYQLDKSKVEKLSHGLQAIEFIVKKSQVDFKEYECFFDLYLNKSLGIRLPEKSEQGSISSYENTYRLFNKKSKHRKHIVNRMYRYKGLVRGLSISLDKDGDSEQSHGVSIFLYKKNLTETLNYIRLRDYSCSAISPPKKGYSFWFKNIKFKKRGIAYNKSDNVIFNLPEKLHKRICPLVEKASYLNLEKQLADDAGLTKEMIEYKTEINNYPHGCS